MTAPVSDAAAPLGWGILGCGWVARDYVAPAIEAAPSARLLAVADPDPAASAGIPGRRAAHRSLEALIATPGLEAVYVATPNHAHRDGVIAAARAGLAVLCEKPMATTPADARAMIAAVAAAGVAYATAYDQRHHPAHAALRAALARGDLGMITQARIHYACWLPRAWSADNWRIDRLRAGGGAAIDLAPHGLDLLATLLGEAPAEISAALQRRVQGYGVDDGAVLWARFPSGALATLNVGYNCPDPLPRRRLELIGTQALAIAEDTMGQDPGGTVTLWPADGGPPRPLAFDADASPFTRQIEAFSRHVRRGEAFPGTPQGDLALTEMLLGALARGEREVGPNAA